MPSASAIRIPCPRSCRGRSTAGSTSTSHGSRARPSRLATNDAPGRDPAPAVSSRWLFAGVAFLALLAGIALWLAGDDSPRTGAPDLAPEALYAATFADASGTPQSLARFAGKIVVVNFWAT